MKKQCEKESDDDDDMIFPTITVMNAAKMMPLAELPVNIVYEIMEATKRVETFKGKQTDCVVLTLRKKKEIITKGRRKKNGTKLNKTKTNQSYLSQLPRIQNCKQSTKMKSKDQV